MNSRGKPNLMGKGIVILLFLIIIGVGLLMFLVPFRGISQSPMKNRPSPEVTILNHSGAIDTRSATYIVHGMAKNTGTVPVVKVYIIVTTYDANGAELGSAYNTLMDLGPGDEAAFTVDARPYYRGKSVARYNIYPSYNLAPTDSL